MIIEFAGIRAKMYSLKMAKREEIVFDTGVESMVDEYEQNKIQKGYKRQKGGDIVKSINYLKHDQNGELQREPISLSAFESSTTKGIKKSIAQAELRHEHFKDTLLYNKPAPKVFIPSFKSINKRIFMFDQQKKTLDPFDDKRHTLLNGCDTLAHGHYRIFCDNVF